MNIIIQNSLELLIVHLGPVVQTLNKINPALGGNFRTIYSQSEEDFRTILVFNQIFIFCLVYITWLGRFRPATSLVVNLGLTLVAF